MKIAMIGAGAMGGALADGFLAGGVVPPCNLLVSDPSEAVRNRFSGKGAIVLPSEEAAADADIVFVVVKPYLTAGVLTSIRPVLTPAKTVVVVAAGVSSKTVRETLGEDIPFALAIPNIAAACRESVTFLVPFMEDCTALKAVFDAVGATFVVPENLLPAGTTLASCGIAYAMRYIRAASEGGVEIGFRANEAKDIVLQTLKGAVALLQQEGIHPEEAIDRVTTPGGVTIKGLNAMEDAGFTASVIRGIKAGMK